MIEATCPHFLQKLMKYVPTSMQASQSSKKAPKAVTVPIVQPNTFWQMAAMSSNTILSSTLHLRKLTFIVLVFKRCARLEHIPFESRVLRQKYTQNRQSTLATLVNNITHHQCEWQSLNFKTT